MCKRTELNVIYFIEQPKIQLDRNNVKYKFNNSMNDLVQYLCQYEKRISISFTSKPLFSV